MSTDPTNEETGTAADSGRDFLEELIAERTERAPHFRAAVEAASNRRSLLRQLASLRDEARISQTELASRMGTSQSAVARLETGEGDPRMSTVERFAAALGINLSWRLEQGVHPNRREGEEASFPTAMFKQVRALHDQAEAGIKTVLGSFSEPSIGPAHSATHVVSGMSNIDITSASLFTRLVCLDIAIGAGDLQPSPFIGALASELVKSYGPDRLKGLEEFLENLESSTP